MLDAALLVFNKVSRNNKNNSKKIMNESIVSTEAKARLTEAVNNYAPPAPKKYRALEEVKECIVELRKKQASYKTIRTILRDNAGIEVSHQTIARYCREVLDAARAKKPRHPKMPTTEPPAAAQGELAERPPFGQSRSRGSRNTESKTL
jgi:spermidine/putrescine-binding protein